MKNGVLLPLVPEGEWAVLFEVRSSNLKHQPGEICFPGGQVDATDTSEQETAVRETCEELQVPRSSIEVLGELDIMLTPFQLILYPYVGILREPQAINPDSREVAGVFTVPLRELLRVTPEYYEMTVEVQPPKNFPLHKIPNGKDYQWRTGILPELFYEFNGYVVWGMTARVLNNFLQIIQEDVAGRSTPGPPAPAPCPVRPRP
ncbi:MAG: CoA pyrophosphatase [Clostridia bacterium]|nr:MAG: CoA pyrophosphatase [Clostridia bacterium]